ncbi:Zn-ribbon domain-containing OB-fold protein [Candidatus Poriferisocius sp.]|uniref:Zn-ribbon domain-containing OB-fold protein n=1 Tax=Candidatus Poriferisocius sp. TaxID=3101276 RepID=UPI003B5B68FB
MTAAKNVAQMPTKWIWDGLVDSSGEMPRLLGSRCPSCGNTFYPPVKDCPTEVLQGKAESVALSGRGRIVSFSVIQRGLPGFASPYALANIELEEGPTCIAQLEDWDSAALTLGQPVEFVVGVIRTDEDGDAVFGPKFKPTTEGGQA